LLECAEEVFEADKPTVDDRVVTSSGEESLEEL